MPKTTIRRANGADREFMSNVIEKYLYELSQYPTANEKDMDTVGRYVYPYLESYFFPRGERDGERRLYIIESGKRAVGFAMVNTVSPFKDVPDYEGATSPDWCMAEFTIFPRYRGKGMGRAAADLILAENPGKWALRYDSSNKPAKRLWTALCKDLNGTIHEVGRYSRIATFEV